MTTAEGFAPAKINLTLHVTGQRADGYHLLDSLVVFADVGDRVSYVPGPDPLSLRVTGPLAKGVPRGPDNLILRAASAKGVVTGALILEKHLPMEAGIGGGSSDAAATLRLLGTIPDDRGLSLGADVPVCLTARAARMRGIGERIDPIADLPKLYAVLANPGVSVPTPTVFQGFGAKDNPPMSELPRNGGAASFLDWLGAQRNDLQAPAITAQPVISTVLGAIADTGSVLVRMSGSGATCFGLFEDNESAGAAARQLRRDHPDWWVQPVTLA